MAVWRGGRGVKAPYDTVHVRIPLPIKAEVERLSQAYKESVVNGEIKESEEHLTYEDAVELAKEILKSKKSARVSIEKLLTGIYKREVEL